MTPEEIEAVVVQVLEKIGVGSKPHPDAPSPAQEYYSIKNCAFIAGVSPDHIRRAIVGATLPASDLGTKDHPLYRVHRDHLREWAEIRQSGAKPPMKKSKPLVSAHIKSRKAKQLS